MRLILTSFVFVSILSSANLASANVVKLCRPKVLNPVQVVSQFVQYPTVPMCKKGGQGIYKIRKNHFFNSEKRFIDEKDTIYWHPSDSSRKGKVDSTRLERVRN